MTDTTTTPQPIQLTQAAVKHLRQLLNSLNWATETWLLKHGGDALELLPEPELEPVIANTATVEDFKAFRIAEKEWTNKLAAPFTLSPKQSKAVKRCLEFYAPKAVLPPGKHSNALLDTFGVEVKEPEEGGQK